MSEVIDALLAALDAAATEGPVDSSDELLHFVFDGANGNGGDATHPLPGEPRSDADDGGNPGGDRDHLSAEESNDSEHMMGTPAEQSFSDDAASGHLPTPPVEPAQASVEPPLVEAAVVSDNGDDNGDDNEGEDEENGPCSNDNPDYDLETQPCPGANITAILDGAVADDPPLVEATAPAAVGTGNGNAGNDGGGNDGGDGQGEGGDGQGGQGGATSGDQDLLDIIGGDAEDSTSTGATAATGATSASTSSVATAAPGDGANDSNGGTADSSGVGDASPEDGNADEANDGTEDTAVNTVDVVDGAKGNPSFYSCSASSQEELSSDPSNEALPFSFTYEIYTPSSVEDVDSVLGTFERNLANGVASALGLADCPELAVEVAVRNSELPWGGTRRTLLRKNEEESGEGRGLSGSMVTGLSVDPTDAVDERTPKCSTTMSLGVPARCSPVIGAMTAWITDSQRRNLRALVDAESKAQQEALLLDAVETYIQDNSDSYKTPELLHVAYIGKRDPEVDFAVDETSGGNNEGSALQPDEVKNTDQVEIDSRDAKANYGLIGLAVAAAVLAIVAFGAAWAYHRRRRRQRDRGGSRRAEGNRLDLESTGAFPMLTPESQSRGDTENALPPPEEGESGYDDSTPFGLNGARASDESTVDDSNIVPPSSLAALGAASMLARQLSYSPQASPGPPPNSPSSDQVETAQPSNQEAAQNISSSDDEPLVNNDDTDPSSFDMAPLSPMTEPAEDTSVHSGVSEDTEDSSVFEAVDENGTRFVHYVTPDTMVSPIQKSDSAAAKTDSAMAMLDNGDNPPTSPERNDDDDDEDDDDDDDESSPGYDADQSGESGVLV